MNSVPARVFLRFFGSLDSTTQVGLGMGTRKRGRRRGVRNVFGTLTHTLGVTIGESVCRFRLPDSGKIL